MLNRYQFTQENIVAVPTAQLAVDYYKTKDDIAASKGLALVADSNDKKEIVLGYVNKDSLRYNLILNELKSRGIKKVRRDGTYA